MHCQGLSASVYHIFCLMTSKLTADFSLVSRGVLSDVKRDGDFRVHGNDSRV